MCAKNLIPLCFILIATTAFTQQDPLYAGEGQRNFWFNPASIGTYNLYSVNSSVRKQWVGLEGAPTSFQLNGATKLNAVFNDNIPLANSALGIRYDYDQIGYIRMHRVVVPLNVKFKLYNTYLSIGLAPGVNTHLFSYEEETPYPGFPATGTSQSKFTTDAGVQWYGKRFSLGFASTHLTEEHFEKLHIISRRHYYINGSYRHPFSEKFAIQSTAVYRTVDGFHSINGMLYGVFGAKNELSFGLGYRHNDILVGAITKRFDKFFVGYFAEYYTSPLSNGSFSHELRIAFELFDANL